MRWDDIEALFISIGGTISEGRGSRMRVTIEDVDANFHRPHPRKECDKGALKSVRRFLTEVGCCP
ncbi:type II toxin-antitoxin system HicA family toxin [Caulobacter sp. LjRoot300]|uniref:type II toxin-antitoxin system HicA family toxin n=1 Tax=Caulobacter sp. LjRoot300 TaxID=3342321 RepID=UPI003F4F8ABE